MRGHGPQAAQERHLIADPCEIAYIRAADTSAHRSCKRDPRSTASLSAIAGSAPRQINRYSSFKVSLRPAAYSR